MQANKEDLVTNIKSRVIEVANFKGVSLEKFFLELGVTYGSFKGKHKKTSLNSSVIERLHQLYPDISLEWLISGKGSMTTTHNGGGNVLGDNNVYQSIITPSLREVAPKTIEDRTAKELAKHKEELINELRQQITELKGHISTLKNELDRKDIIISHLINHTHTQK